MKKSFREQMEVVINERHSSDDAKYKKQKLDKATTPAAETLITYIRQWNFGSRNIALGRLLECDRWTNEGTLTLERNHKGKPYPVKLPLSFAYERYMYGDQKRQYFPMYSFVRGVNNIPANLTDDWAAELKGMFFDLCRVPLNDVKLIALGKWVKSLGANNPHAIAGWERNVTEWQDAIKAINAYVKDRDGWQHLDSTNLQKPESKREMSKVLDDILANADAVKEPAFKALKEQSRRDRIRQDATHARNSIKELKGFFQKYGVDIPNAAILLGGIVDDVESQCLTSPITPV